MILNDIKPLGAFIENTIRPLVAEAKDILSEFEKQGFPLTEKRIIAFSKTIATLHLRTVIIQAIRDIIIAIIIAGVLWKTQLS